MNSHTTGHTWLARAAVTFFILLFTGSVLWFTPLFHFDTLSILNTSPSGARGGSTPAARPPGPGHNRFVGPREYQETLIRAPVSRGPYRVSGKRILGADGRPYLFHGVARDGLQYSCSGDGHFSEQELSYIGAGPDSASATYWHANTVRLPLSEGFWLRGDPAHGCSPQQYQALVGQVADSLTALGLNVLLDLQWNDAGQQSGLGGGQWPLPDADSVSFWKQVAGLYKGYNNVLFELFNEPNNVSWSCWQRGCTLSDASALSNDCGCQKTLSYRAVGMQGLIDAVRGTGARNLLLVAGLNWGFDLSKIDSYPLRGSNLVYDTHPYAYAGKFADAWAAAFGRLSATHAMISAESGEYDCGSAYMRRLLDYFDAHAIGWIAWSWTTAGDVCHYPRLIQNYNGRPTMAPGQFIHDRLVSYSR